MLIGIWIAGELCLLLQIDSLYTVIQFLTIAESMSINLDTVLRRAMDEQRLKMDSAARNSMPINLDTVLRRAMDEQRLKMDSETVEDESWEVEDAALEDEKR
jgi:hydroxyethylthiazole kinase-like sugar kinase family protein